MDNTDFNDGQRNGWENRTDSGRLYNEGENLYWRAIGNGEFQCGLSKSFAYEDLPFGKNYKISFKFRNNLGHGCMIQVVTDDNILWETFRAPANEWVHGEFEFSTAYSPAQKAVKIDIHNSPVGRSQEFSLDDISIFRL